MVELCQEYYMWMEIDSEGKEGSILCNVEGFGNINLVARSYVVATTVMKRLAFAHMAASGHEIRLIKWTHREELEVIKRHDK